MLQPLDVGSLMTCPDLVLLAEASCSCDCFQSSASASMTQLFPRKQSYNRNRNACKAEKKRDLESRLEHIKQHIHFFFCDCGWWPLHLSDLRFHEWSRPFAASAHWLVWISARSRGQRWKYSDTDVKVSITGWKYKNTFGFLQNKSDCQQMMTLPDITEGGGVYNLHCSPPQGGHWGCFGFALRELLCCPSLSVVVPWMPCIIFRCFLTTLTFIFCSSSFLVTFSSLSVHLQTNSAWIQTWISLHVGDFLEFLIYFFFNGNLVIHT